MSAVATDAKAVLSAMEEARLREANLTREQREDREKILRAPDPLEMEPSKAASHSLRCQIIDAAKHPEDEVWRRKLETRTLGHARERFQQVVEDKFDKLSESIVRSERAQLLGRIERQDAAYEDLEGEDEPPRRRLVTAKAEAYDTLVREVEHPTSVGRDIGRMLPRSYGNDSSSFLNKNGKPYYGKRTDLLDIELPAVLFEPAV